MTANKSIFIDNLVEFEYVQRIEEDCIIHSLIHSDSDVWSEGTKNTLAFEIREFTVDSSLEFSFPAEINRLNLAQAEWLDILLRLILRNESMPERVIEIATRQRL